MLKLALLVKQFSYVPKIKFLGPRRVQHERIPSQPSIFKSTLVYPQLTDEEIEIVNMGGARDAGGKPKKGDKK
jgi:hypothetical protein